VPAKKIDAEAKSAWLITWEGTSAAQGDQIVAILSPRQSASSVRDFVELLYVSLIYSPKEKLLLAKDPKSNPYPATMTVRQHIHCGHNPHLHARLVFDLKVIDGKPTWSEPHGQDQAPS
jgi:hypothetical protein